MRKVTGDMNKVFTFFLEWDGGTFISQYSSLSLSEAVKRWASSLDMATIGASDESKKNFLIDVDAETAIKVSGLNSVWCITPYIKGRLAMVHIVETIC